MESGGSLWSVDIPLPLQTDARTKLLTWSLQRVDPNRIYWMRNEGAVTPALPDEEASSEGARSRAGSRDGPNPGTLRRPPSYSSDDGVSYVVEAQPRSIAPATDVPTGGRAGRRLA